MTEGPDPITLEVIRNRLAAIAREMSTTVVRTAVSTVISEARDFSCTIFDRDGNLVAGAATVLFHFGVVAHAARTILGEYGEDLEPGDVFFANDPHHGGGLHPQDVIVLRPVFEGGERIAWAGASGHMLDVGGMVPGSFAPAARECYQEAIRVPPVKIFRGGALDRGVWNLILNNVRMADKVAMDLMSLVSGTSVADEKVRALRPRYGAEVFDTSLRRIQDLSEAALRRRIAELPEGEYVTRSWVEYGEETFPVVCTLHVAGGELVFDYAGSAPQCPYFFNSKAHIVESELVIRVYQILTPDVPFTQGVLRPLRIVAPGGSIVDSEPPAPISAAHMHVGLLAMELGEACLKKALACSRSPRRTRITGMGGTTGLGNTSWTARNERGAPETFLLMDGNGVGAGACLDRDGIHLTGSNYGGPGLVYPDVEIVEQTSPILLLWKRLRIDSGGAGRFRGGASVDEAFTPHGTGDLEGTLFGMRRHVPVNGLFGGMPGACTRFERIRGARVPARLRSGEDLGRREALGPALEWLPNNTGGVALGAGDVFLFGCASGGGLGDPLEREPDAVARDVRRGLVSAEAARDVYGVVRDARGEADTAATTEQRATMRRARLGRAVDPRRPVEGNLPQEAEAVGSLGLAVTVVRENNRLVAGCASCRRRLAVAPGSWKNGAAAAVSPLGEIGAPGSARRIVLRELFCPGCAALLEAEAILDATPVEDDVRPTFWTA